MKRKTKCTAANLVQLHEALAKPVDLISVDYCSQLSALKSIGWSGQGGGGVLAQLDPSTMFSMTALLVLPILADVFVRGG